MPRDEADDENHSSPAGFSRTSESLTLSGVDSWGAEERARPGWAVTIFAAEPNRAGRMV